MGVADGIYMWREMGIDAGRMSRELMAQCKAMIEADDVDIFKGTGYGQAAHARCSQESLIVVMVITGALLGEVGDMAQHARVAADACGFAKQTRPPCSLCYLQSLGCNLGCVIKVVLYVMVCLAVLSSAVDHVLSSGIQGSTTVCLLAVDTTTGALHSANIGDSGFIVFGRKQVGRATARVTAGSSKQGIGLPDPVPCM
jgi:hypothetical protein